MGCYHAVERLDPSFFVVDSCKEVCIPLHKHHSSHSLKTCRASSAWPWVSPLAVLVTNSSLGAVLAKELLALEGLTLRDAWHKSPVGLRACSSLADWPETRSSLVGSNEGTVSDPSEVIALGPDGWCLVFLFNVLKCI